MPPEDPWKLVLGRLDLIAVSQGDFATRQMDMASQLSAIRVQQSEILDTLWGQRGPGSTQAGLVRDMTDTKAERVIIQAALTRITSRLDEIDRDLREVAAADGQRLVSWRDMIVPSLVVGIILAAGGVFWAYVTTAHPAETFPVRPHSHP